MSSLRWIAAVAAVFLIAAVGLAVLGGTSSPGVSGPAASPSPTSAPSSSVGVAGACDLMSPDEAGNALYISSPVVAESLLDFTFNKQDIAAPTVPSAFCGFRSGSTSLFVLRYENPGADAFASWKESTGVEAVSGLGDDAVWDPAKTTLYILKGDRLVTIMPLGGPDPTLTLEAAKAIGAIVVGRM